MLTCVYKPPNSEVDGYYYGLAESPRLVARTSTNQWRMPAEKGDSEFPTNIAKHFAPIREQELVSKWSIDVSNQLIRVLEKCAWTSFFPVRIGLEHPEGRWDTNRFPKLVDTVAILLISVEPDSLQWEQAIEIAFKCRRILQSFRIEDVEVEIKEGVHTLQAASAELEAQVQKQTSVEGQQTNQAALPMLSYSGYPVGYLEEIRGQGTIGLHLQLNGQGPTFYGLTCRHVVSHDREPEEAYVFSGEKHQFHVQANNSEYQNNYNLLQVQQEDLEQEIAVLRQKEERWSNWYQFDPTKTHLEPSREELETLESRRTQLEYHEKVFNLIKGLSKKSSRQIGHLWAHPHLQLSSTQHGYLKDWALIQMDPKKFDRGPENQVFVGDSLKRQMQKAGKTMGPLYYEHCKEGVLSLRVDDQEESETSYFVAKQGATTGLTLGEKSAIEAVLRHPLKNGKPIYSWEMLILPAPGQHYFSKAGDSGSCVFDITGRIIGMLVASSMKNADGTPDQTRRGVMTNSTGSREIKVHTGSNVRPEDAEPASGHDIKSWPEGSDVTFVTPIKWVLEDIEDFTGRRPLVAGMRKTLPDSAE